MIVVIPKRYRIFHRTPTASGDFTFSTPFSRARAIESVTAIVMLADSAAEIVEALKARARGIAPDDVTALVVRRAQ